MNTKPYIIKFNKLGKPSQGYISVAELDKDIPFKVKRIFWTYYTPESIVRGRHAHHNTQLVLIAAAGKITVHTELPSGEVFDMILEDPSVGLYIPSKTWHTMKYSHNAVQLVIASTVYREKDYIREYDLFKSI
jgi:hypothetical protein